MQSYLPPEDVKLTLEEPAAAAATNRDHCPWATQEVAVVLVEVHGSVCSHLDKELAAAAAVHQDCQAVVVEHQTSLYDHLDQLMMVATNRHLEVDCHCRLNRHHQQVDCCHCLKVERSHCQAARSLESHCLALHHTSQSLRCHPG